MHFNEVRHRIIQFSSNIGNRWKRKYFPPPFPICWSLLSPLSLSFSLFPLPFLGLPCIALMPPLFLPFLYLVSVLGLQVGLEVPKPNFPSVLKTQVEVEALLTAADSLLVTLKLEVRREKRKWKNYQFLLPSSCSSSSLPVPQPRSTRM